VKSTQLVISLSGLAITWSSLQADEVTRDPSPDGNFSLLLTTQQDGAFKVELIEIASHRVMLQLTPIGHPWIDDSRLLWSDNSQRVAFFRDSRRGGKTTVYFRNDTGFKEIPLPSLPDCNRALKPRERISKDIAFGVAPRRWLKSGALVLDVDYEWTTSRGSLQCVETVIVTFDGQHTGAVRGVTRKITRNPE
jgi:hypothetical protein